MKAHPLFCDDENDIDRLAQDIEFINIIRLQGGKRIGLPNQWEPEQLQSLQDVYDAVGGPGDYELIGRDKKMRIVLRERINLEAPKGYERPAQPATPINGNAVPPMPPLPVQPGVPMMNLGSIQIPAGVDPHIAMMMFNAQLAQIDKDQARGDARAHEVQMVQMFTAFSNNQTALVTGLVGALANRGSPTGENAADTFIKGVDVAVQLVAGMKEGTNIAPPEQTPTWAETTKNIVESLKVVKDIASLGNSAPGAPIIPPNEIPQ